MTDIQRIQEIIKSKLKCVMADVEFFKKEIVEDDKKEKLLFSMITLIRQFAVIESIYYSNIDKLENIELENLISKFNFASDEFLESCSTDHSFNETYSCLDDLQDMYNDFYCD